MTNTYRPMIRPASMVTLPQGITWEYIQAPWDLPNLSLPRAPTRYGVISTDRVLTKDECERFDLQPL